MLSIRSKIIFLCEERSLLFRGEDYLFRLKIEWLIKDLSKEEGFGLLFLILCPKSWNRFSILKLRALGLDGIEDLDSSEI